MAGDRESFLGLGPGTGRGWLESLLSVLFPGRCLFCRAILPFSRLEPFCPACRRHYRPGGRICPFCEGFFREQAPCSCRPDDSPLQGLFVIALYDQGWRRLIHDLKYRNRRSVFRPLGAWLAAEIVNSRYCRPDLVAPVPLHPRREKERGYNQGALLARHTARALGVPCRSLLAREKHTRSQTAISRLERQENVRGVFRALEADHGGATVLLIDDVYSTGSTMKEAAAALQASGAKVFGAALAYNPGPRILQRSGFYGGLEQW